MSDPNPGAATTPATPAPAANGATTPAGTQAPAQQAPATPAPAAAQPYRAFADQKELDDFVKGAKTQAERAGIRKLAKDLGFEDVDEMREALGTLRQAQGAGAQAQPNQPETPAAAGTQANDAARLQMALTVGTKLNLPVALIGRLQGTTPEEMEADAQTLLALMGNGQARAPGIPPVPAGNTPVTFTATQLKDADFVRKNVAAIQAAAREGRIVRS